jgi:4-amino-4-deoxy-L-arabinose transferase-like glycosyltransferase
VWIVPAFLHGGTGFFRRLVVDQTAERLSGQGNHVEAWWYYLVTFPKGALPWSPLYVGAALLLASRRARGLLGDGAHVLAALTVLAVLSAVPTKEVRYSTILVPPLAVAAAQVLSALADRARDPARWARPLRVAGLVAVAAAGVGVVLASRAPSSLPWALPPLLALGAAGVLAARRPAAPGEAPRAILGRHAGLAVLFGVTALLVYWTVLPRREAIEAVKENRAVASVLPAGVPVVVLGGGPDALDTDDVFEAAPDATYAGDPAAIPAKGAASDVVVVCLERQAEAAEAARGEAPTRLLARPRRGDAARMLVVLRFGGPR